MMTERIAAGLSARTALYLRAILRKALNKKVRQGQLVRNAASLASPPKVEQYRVDPFTPEEARALLAAIWKGNRFEALYVTAMGTGMRQGELLGLKWEDVDLERGTIAVRHQLQRIGGKPALVPTKSDRSRRNVALPGIVVATLRRHWTAQQEARLVAGERWQEHGFVFTTGIGTSLNPSNITHYFQRTLSDVGLRRQRFHDLRHCAAPSCWHRAKTCELSQMCLDTAQSH